MKRTDLTVGMKVAVKHGYGDPHQAEVLSLEPHRKATRFSQNGPTPGGTGVLVRLVDARPEYATIAVPLNQVLAEWAAYEAERAAHVTAREAYNARRKEEQETQRAKQAAAVTAAAKVGLWVSVYGADRNAVQIKADDLAALLAALPEGFTLPKAN